MSRVDKTGRQYIVSCQQSRVFPKKKPPLAPGRDETRASDPLVDFRESVHTK